MQNFTRDFCLKSILKQTPHIWWLSIDIGSVIYAIEHPLFVTYKYITSQLNELNNSKSWDRQISASWELACLTMKIVDYTRSISSYTSSQIFRWLTRIRKCHWGSLNVHRDTISQHSRRMRQEINKKFIFLKSLGKHEWWTGVFQLLSFTQRGSASVG